jgi:hypothetical protein
MAARRVWWRSTAARRPPVSNRNRSSRWAAISPGARAMTRAAASSMAKGMPSSLRQISAIAGPSADPRTKSAPAASALSRNSCAASDPAS